jgi:hypothetical protein
MQENKPLTTFEVKELVYYWFKKLTDHEPIEEMLQMLNTKKLEMSFPDTAIRSEEDFRSWYKTVTNLFFDQVHELKMLDIVINGDKADVKLVVNWQARTWEPPAGYSKWEGVYAHQTWLIEKNSNTGKPVISTYIVDKFEPMAGPLKI